MFDIGFWELSLIGVIALLVVGPERLPALARNVGMWVGRIRRYVSHVKQDIESELHAEEVRDLLQKPEGLESIRDVARETASILDDTRKELNQAEEAARDDDDSASSTPPVTPPASATASEPVPQVPHHDVDDDPFAPASLAQVTPDTDASESVPHTPAEPDPQPSVPDHEQQPERQGQR